ncbi:MAG: anti-sigma factor [Lewinellaceae bacterium]|nr:anti-sigma factor [Saprospiraceae bacterium]MCB9340481.1 anti-sigma factor [Lewinellaceae bacterium]
MDNQSFISSGILERYVAGLASAEDEQDIRDLMDKHVAIREELDNIYLTLEAYARAHAVSPPEALKQKTLQVLSESPKPSTKGKVAPTPKAPVSERPKNEKTAINWTATIAALLGLALIGACVGIFLFMSQANKARQELGEVQGAFEEYKKNTAAEMAALSGIKQEYDALRHPANRPILLAGVKSFSSQAFAVVYWNPDSQTAFLDVKNLPPPPTGKAYQLWTSVDGKGQFLATMAAKTASKTLQSIPFIEKPQSFYATLEDEGQTAEPSLKNVILFGRVEKI